MDRACHLLRVARGASELLSPESIKEASDDLFGLNNFVGSTFLHNAEQRGQTWRLLARGALGALRHLAPVVLRILSLEWLTVRSSQHCVAHKGHVVRCDKRHFCNLVARISTRVFIASDKALAVPALKLKASCV